MTRLQGILAAGGLTGIVLATAVALGLKDFNQASTPAAAPVVIPAIQQQASPTVDPAILAAIETQYQAQIEQANQTIQQLQAERDQLARQAGAQASRGDEHEFEEDDDD